MNKAGWVLAFLGFTGVIALIAYYGGGEVLDAMALAGFWGLFWVSAFPVFPLIADVIAWAHVFRPTDRPRTFTLTWTRWVAESVNKLLPVAQLGGEFVRARLISQAGVRGPVGGATVVVDMTIGVFTQVIFSLMGVAALYLVADAGESRNLGQGLLFGLGVFSLLFVGFYVAQHYGLFLVLARALEKVAGGREFMALSGGAAALDDEIVAAYRRLGALFWSSVWRLASWVIGAGEVWLAMYFLGHPVTLMEAVMLESLSQAARGAAFFVPAGLGVQEVGLVALGAMIGIGPELALALSLVKRVRELVLGLPALLAWQLAEGKRLWRHRPPPAT